MATDEEIAGILGDNTPGDESLPQQVNDAVDAPTIFADGLIFATRIGNNVRIQFAEYIPQAGNSRNPGLKTRNVLNLVMDLEGYRAMMQYLTDVNPKYIFVQDDDGRPA